MAVVKEWHCNGCGLDFDSTLNVCGRCGATDPYVMRAFRTAPGFMGDTTKATDNSLSRFTKQYGLSDFSNNQSTKHEKNFDNLWAPVSDLASMPELISQTGEAALLKSIGPEAQKSIGSKKIVVGKEKAA